MAPAQRLASVTESVEESGENVTEKTALEPLKKNKQNSGRNPNQLHVTIKATPEEIECENEYDNNTPKSSINNRRPSAFIQDILSSRRPSSIMEAIRSPKQFVNRLRRESSVTSVPSSDMPAMLSMRKNRRFGDDSLSSSLSAFYAKMMIIIGIALPVTELLTQKKVPQSVYLSFYVYLYLISILFVIFVYSAHMRTKAVFTLIKTYHEETNQDYSVKKRSAHFGSFYLRVGAIDFAIGSMVYSGLELGQYFELNNHGICPVLGKETTFLNALTPIARMLLCIIQMQFIFLNTTDLDMGRHKVVCRFGIMHLIATNICEWLHVLVEETQHDIYHGSNHQHHSSTNTTFVDITTPLPHSITPNNNNCTEIMTSLIQKAAPFLFPCTIEYSLICAVILYEMFKNVKSINDIERQRRNSIKTNLVPHATHQFSVDCSQAHRGMFGGIIIIVLTIISLIMYFVLSNEEGEIYKKIAIKEVIFCEMVLYILTAIAVLCAVTTMRDLKFLRKKNDHHDSTVKMDCNLLIVAQTGVYLYGSFSIIGSFYNALLNIEGSVEELGSETLCLIQTSLQTLFILNASWRKCKGAQQNRCKPGRQMVTFLLVANMSLWFIYTLIKGQRNFVLVFSVFTAKKDGRLLRMLACLWLYSIDFIPASVYSKYGEVFTNQKNQRIEKIPTCFIRAFKS